MNQVAITIPIYKDKLTEFEAISLKQCFKVLGTYKIIFIAPLKLKNGSIHNLKKEKAEFIFLDDKNFDSIVSYNHMMLSDWFYKQFLNYNYILIYQLDSFVFKDELQYWISKGFSYIGAPWFESDSEAFMGVGNGGFSLRNVKDSIAILSSNKKIHSLKEHIIRNKKSKKSLYVFRGIRHYFNSHTFKTIKNDKLVNEDKIFSLAGKRFKNFKIPNAEEALEFAFEKQSKKLYELNKKQLPFGCHAWWTYDLEFYKPFLEDLGYKLNG